MIETRPGSGSFVAADAVERVQAAARRRRDASPHDASPSALLEARSLLEPRVAALAARHGRPDPYAEELLARMDRAADGARRRRLERRRSPLPPPDRGHDRQPGPRRPRRPRRRGDGPAAVAAPARRVGRGARARAPARGRAPHDLRGDRRRRSRCRRLLRHPAHPARPALHDPRSRRDPCASPASSPPSPPRSPPPARSTPRRCRPTSAPCWTPACTASSAPAPWARRAA